MDVTPAVVPRWEWRTFADQFPAVAAQLTQAAQQVRTSAETYLLAGAAATNVKIRNELLDVKRRLRVDRGLELWTPVLKSGFPIDAEPIATIFGLWALAAPQLARATYTLPQFFAEVVAATPEVRVAEVTKERHGTVIDGCTVEVATLSVAGRHVQTVAVEAEDADAVLQVVRALGLTGHPNENYVRALTRLLDLGPADAAGTAPACGGVHGA